jgi:hypothetical protein
MNTNNSVDTSIFFVNEHDKNQEQHNEHLQLAITQ